MKSQKSTILFVIMFAIISSAWAAPLTGTYTIGGTTPNFPTIKNAIDTLVAQGVSGAVTFNIRPGTYNEKVDIGLVAGVSALNTITFKSENNDSTSVVITDSSSLTTANYTVHVFGTDYLTFRSLTLQRSGALAQSTVISIAADSRYLQFRNCIIQNDNTTSSGTPTDNSLIYAPFCGSHDSLITISDCILSKGYYGLYLNGQSVNSMIPLTQITNNQFMNQGYCSVFMHFCSAPNITGNTISTTTNNFDYRAITFERVSHDMKILSNKFTGMVNGEVLYLDSAYGDSGTPGLIANNFIQSEGSGTADGLFINQCKNLNIYYNTVNNSTIGNFGSAIRVNNPGDSALNVRNNIFVNTGGGYTFYVTNGASGSITVSDYNDLYVAPNDTTIAYFDTADVATLADWKTVTGKDANSVSADPQFISSTNLHVGNPAVNNNAVVISAVTTDIDGQNRSNSTPDIGADEFTPLNNNLGTETFLLPVKGVCGDSATSVSVIIHNYGLAAQTGFDVKADLTGAVTQSLTETYSGSLPSNQSDTINFTQTFITYAGGVVDIKAFTSLAADQYNDNDTITGSFTFMGHPNAPVVTSPQQQCDNNIQITGVPDSGDVLVWYDSLTGGNLLFAGNVFSPPITTDTTFYVESHTGSGGTGCLRITEIDPNDVSTGDYLEITNLSGVGFDATGWKVVAGDNSGDINAINAFTWSLGYFNPGEVQFKIDVGSGPTYWGTNLNWTGGFGGWVMIIDNNGNVIDFVAFDWDSTAIQGALVSVAGFNVTPGTAWHGPGYVSCGSPMINERIGSDDHDDASDWGCGTPNRGTQSPNLSGIFQHCGIGVCGSLRIPVSVTLIAGATPVNLGPDTVVGNNDSLLLDAGAGYTSYLWSNGDTTQSTYAMQGTYWVLVTGGANNCSFSDTIIINTPVGIKSLYTEDEVSLYPNPATNRIVIHAHETFLNSAMMKLTDVEGRNIEMRTVKGNAGEIILDTSNLNNGFYFLQIISGNRTGVKKFSVLR